MPAALRLILLSLFSGVCLGQSPTPEAALVKMRAGTGLEARLIAAEPLVQQPLSISFDSRGRMWVLQYLQYPYPSGLKPVTQDQYLRTRWDQIPLPPPKGPRGADKITILDDPDATGRYRSAKDFIEGLNLATGFAIGHGGVFVLQAPYLLFYPDRDQDDRADSDPEVLLTGFGMEDSHAHANSLQWGPDGWLYGAQGSTVTALIRGIGFQQGIWRYHPKTRQFELFSEGGGNTWGLDFDKNGEIISGTNFGDVACLHQRQGSYHVKGFAKHGPLHNAHTYGYFDHIPYKGFQGGHVTCGGVVYQGGGLGTSFEGQYIAGNLLSSMVNWHLLRPEKSSFTASHAGIALNPRDPWFRPIDLLVGPDAGVYVVDWYDKRATHLDPLDTWDKTNGRIYRLHKPGAPPIARENLAALGDKALVKLLADPNIWKRREARQILTQRKAIDQAPVLRDLVAENDAQTAIEALWALYGVGGLDEPFTLRCLDSKYPTVRLWAMRLACDAKKVSPAMLAGMENMLRDEPSPMVRAQGACSARRLPVTDGLTLMTVLLNHSEDIADPQIPLLLWWALEDFITSDSAQVANWTGKTSNWSKPIFLSHLAERLGRRLVAENKPADNSALAQVWEEAPDTGKPILISGLSKGLAGLAHHQVPHALNLLANHLCNRWRQDPHALEVATRLGNLQARKQAQEACLSKETPIPRRVQLLGILVQASPAWAAEKLIALIPDSSQPLPLRRAAAENLAGVPESAWADRLVTIMGTLPPEVSGPARRLLLSRPGTARAFLAALEKKPKMSNAPTREESQVLMELNDPLVSAWVGKTYGKLGTTSGEKNARISYIDLVVGRLPPGDFTRGKALFTKQQCASCHVLFGEGIKLGPDLTTADRGSRRALVAHIVDPSGSIRPEFQAQVVETTSGQVITGLVVESNVSTITLANAKNERVILQRAKIESISPAANSFMPEKLLDGLKDEDLADFFLYLMAPKPAG